MWKIIGTYQGRREVVDTADTLREAAYLLREYRVAFGPEWVIKIRRPRKRGV